MALPTASSSTSAGPSQDSTCRMAWCQLADAQRTWPSNRPTTRAPNQGAQQAARGGSSSTGARSFEHCGAEALLQHDHGTCFRDPQALCRNLLRCLIGSKGQSAMPICRRSGGLSKQSHENFSLTTPSSVAHQPMSRALCQPLGYSNPTGGVLRLSRARHDSHQFHAPQ